MVRARGGRRRGRGCVGGKGGRGRERKRAKRRGARRRNEASEEEPVAATLRSRDVGTRPPPNPNPNPPRVRPEPTRADREPSAPSLHAHDRELDLFDFGELPLFVAQRTVASRAEPLGDAVQVEDVSAVSPRDAQALVRGDRGVRLVLDRGLVQAVPANRARVRADGPRPDRDGVPLRGRAGGGGGRGARSFEFRDLARARGGGAGLGGGAREEERARARTFLTSKRRFSATSVMLGAKGGRGGEVRRAPRSALKQKSSQHGGETTNSDCTARSPGRGKKNHFFCSPTKPPPPHASTSTSAPSLGRSARRAARWNARVAAGRAGSAGGSKKKSVTTTGIEPATADLGNRRSIR